MCTAFVVILSGLMHAVFPFLLLLIGCSGCNSSMVCHGGIDAVWCVINVSRLCNCSLHIYPHELCLAGAVCGKRSHLVVFLELGEERLCCEFVCLFVYAWLFVLFFGCCPYRQQLLSQEGPLPLSKSSF